MPSTTFSAYLATTYTNRDLALGASIVASFSGGSIPSGAQITSATLYISSMRVYTAKGLYLTLGSLGSTSSMALNESVHSNNLSVSGTSSLASFTGGAVTITLNTSQSTSGTVANFRDGCYLTLTVNYTEAASVTTGYVSPSSVETGSAISLYLYAAANTYHSAVWT